MAKQKKTKITNLKVTNGGKLPSGFASAVQLKDWEKPVRLQKGVYILEAYNGKEAETYAFVPTHGFTGPDFGLLYTLTLREVEKFARARYKNKKLTLVDWFNETYPQV